MTTDRENMPSRIRRLPIDHRGFPVPWFVQWLDDGKPVPTGQGVPDFRVMDSKKMAIAVKQRRCWVCGDPLGRHQVFTIGPMCAINRVISEPPSHLECAEFSVKACPFLSRPRMRRNMKDLPDHPPPAGFHLDRNPGAMCLWRTPSFKAFRPNQGGAGVLFALGDPDLVVWYAEGRAASRAEVLHSITTGLPHLGKLASDEGPEGIAAFEKAIVRALPLLPFDTETPIPSVAELMAMAGLEARP